MYELYVTYFGNDFRNNYLSSLGVIRDYIAKFTNSFSISTYDLEIDDLSKKRDDKNYLNDKTITFLSNGIKILLPMEDFWDAVKNYIPKTVTSLELPASFIKKDIVFLSSFSSLERLVISDYDWLSPEEIKIIAENTSIKNIYYKCSGLGIDKYAENKGFSVLGSPYGYCAYGDVLYRSIQQPDIDSKLDSYFKPSVNIRTYDFDVTLIEKLYALADNRIKDNITVESNNCKYDIKLNKENGLYKIEVESDNSYDVYKIVNYINKKGIFIDSVLWNMTDTNYYDKDISCLEDISRNTRLLINYGELTDASYEDFVGLLEGVKWYRKIIKDSNLSPVEKVMFAFDILKTFTYKESDVDKDDSRYSHRIIETGNIVCVGYSHLFCQILNYLDDNISVSEFSVDCYDNENKFLGSHSRNLLKIDDDKYNIHGIFVLDATWDSDKSHKMSSEVYSDYTSLDLYRYFLIPASDYVKIFHGNTLPNLFKCYLGNEFSDYSMNREYSDLFGIKYTGNYFRSDISSVKEKNVNKNNISFNDLLSSLNVDVDDKKDNVEDISQNNTDEILKKYLSVSRPSLQQFNEILVNVRMAEGYSKEEAINEVDKVIRINRRIINNMNIADCSNIEFFKEEKGVSK